MTLLKGPELQPECISPPINQKSKNKNTQHKLLKDDGRSSYLLLPSPLLIHPPPPLSVAAAAAAAATAAAIGLSWSSFHLLPPCTSFASCCYLLCPAVVTSARCLSTIFTACLPFYAVHCVLLLLFLHCRPSLFHISPPGVFSTIPRWICHISYLGNPSSSPIPSHFFWHRNLLLKPPSLVFLGLR